MPGFVILQRTEHPILKYVGGVDLQLPGLYVREVNEHRELVLDDERSMAKKFGTRAEAQAAIDAATSNTVGCEIIELKGPDWVGEPSTPKGFMLRALDTGARSREEIRKQLPEHMADIDDETLDSIRKEVIQLAKTKTATKPKTGGNGRAKKEKVFHDCLCGCGAQTLSNFRPGHDAKVYSLLKKEAKGEKVKLSAQLGNAPEVLAAMRARVH